jgi:hypothetical protein
VNNILIDRIALTCWFHLQLEEQLAIVPSLVETPVDSTCGDSSYAGTGMHAGGLGQGK